MPIERLTCLVLAAAIVARVLFLGHPVVPAAWGPQYAQWGHAGLYALIGALFVVGTAGRVPLMVAAAVTVVGGLEELHRLFVLGGHADLVRFLGAAGAAVGAAALMSL